MLTSSLDGSVRIWDLKGEALFGELINEHVLRLRAGGSKAGARCVAISPNGRTIAAGAVDGSVSFQYFLYYLRSIYNLCKLISLIFLLFFFA